MTTNEVIAAVSTVVGVLVILAIWWYLNKRPTFLAAPLANGLKYPGFQTFPTPRTFDSPGTVFRIDRSQIRFPVITLPVSSDKGLEALASYTTTSSWTLSALLRYLTAYHAEVSTRDSFTVSVKVVLGKGFRERTFDLEIDQLLKNAIINYRDDSRYYLVRETISVSEISYEFSGSGGLKSGAKLTIGEMVKGNQALSWSDNSESSLIQKFDKPHRIFFTADELLAPGLGIGESSQRVRSDEPITWEAEH